METLKDAVTIIFGFFALVIAYKGLQTWRLQLKSTADTELARRILIQLYKVQNEVAHLRRPLRETFLPNGINRLDIDAVNKAWAEQYDTEWQSLQKELAELHVACIEAQAVWDKDFPQKLVPLKQCIGELRLHISENIKMQLKPVYTSHLNSEEMDMVLYGLGKDGDSFAQKVEDAILQVDKDTRPFLVK